MDLNLNLSNVLSTIIVAFNLFFGYGAPAPEDGHVQMRSQVEKSDICQFQTPL